ncbi:HAMP domain-containing sensor histidine kinase [Saccharibacillus sp. CPCC 101409]|uniref:sensor histidine kinase n=1 Tax=Saccharibacillus sp. CPCC 101409 TaxID=3058041 RepID=UPI00267416F5|nr:HAMP domain-containing sensor histidine kinase [Saccharibacillus sp. CPCC 101409]MDO3409843.1 HAMP domain-containing sensor histidine kinase [Saccharibacillus sp. CPCC 101409]
MGMFGAKTSNSSNPLFSKLRNRFLIVNLVTIVVIMLVAFATIYVITYRQVHDEIGMDLDRTTNLYRSGMDGNLRDGDLNDAQPGADGSGNPGQNGSGSGGENTGRSGSAAAERTDAAAGSADNAAADGSESSGAAAGSGESGGDMGGPPPGFGSGDMPPERSVSFMLRTDSTGTLAATESRFNMSVTDDFYAEALSLAQSIGRDQGDFTLDDSRWTFSRLKTSDGTMYVFIDTTSRQSILTTLIYAFLAVGLVMLIVLFFFSRFFANRSIAPVREAFDKQKQFIADASHELKTPLAVINTNADVLLANGDDTIRSQEKWLRYIKSETERMAKLTGDLLYLTEMDDSRTNMVFARFDLSEAVENVMLTMEAVVFEKNLTLDYSIEPGLGIVGSREQIIQVTMILLDNAIKYAGPNGTIDALLKREHGEIVLAVTNTGEGIPAEHLPRVFDRFYRTDKSRARSQGGHGLGLAIAKSIVEQHKGHISASSAIGGKTTFSVRFPA